jgi:hypothetical protein
MIDPPQFYYEFEYIVSSTGSWKRPLISAGFDIRIDRDLITSPPEILDGFELTEREFHGYIHREEWMPRGDLSFSWVQTVGGNFGEEPYGKKRPILIRDIVNETNKMVRSNVSIINERGEIVPFMDRYNFLVYQTPVPYEGSYEYILFTLDNITIGDNLTLVVKAEGYKPKYIPLDHGSGLQIIDTIVMEETGANDDREKGLMDRMDSPIVMVLFLAILSGIILALGVISFHHSNKKMYSEVFREE